MKHRFYVIYAWLTFMICAIPAVVISIITYPLFNYNAIDILVKWWSDIID